MKRLIYVLVVILMAIGISSCSKKQEETQKWEYKTLIAWAELPSEFDYFSNTSIPVPEEEMNKLGEEGWELVSVYTRIQTVHPNFGDKKYVTGLQPNTRTYGVFYVFKRPKQEDINSSEVKDEAVAVEEVATVEEASDTVCVVAAD